MVGSDPEGEDIHAQGAQQLPLLADHVYPEELLPELVLVEEEIERMANFPISPAAPIWLATGGFELVDAFDPESH